MVEYKNIRVSEDVHERLQLRKGDHDTWDTLFEGLMESAAQPPISEAVDYDRIREMVREETRQAIEEVVR